MGSTTAIIVNAMPQMVNRGTQDLSITSPIVASIPLPQHIAYFPTFAKKGQLGKKIVDGATASTIYGADTFDERRQFTTHVTPFMNGAIKKAGTLAIERVLPPDANPEANIQISLDVLPVEMPRYVRNTDGSFQVDVNGDYTPMTDGLGAPLTAIAGYQCKWVATAVTNGLKTGATSLSSVFGARTIGAGTQTGTVGGNPVTSQLYPIFDLKADFGDDANNTGLRFWSPVEGSGVGVDSNYITETKAYPLAFSIIRRTDKSTVGLPVDSIYGGKMITAVLKPGALNPLTNTRRVNIADSLLASYSTDGTDGNFPIPSDFTSFAVYQNNIDTLTNLFYQAEKTYIFDHSDITGTGDEKYLFNFVGGHDSTGAPYETFRFADRRDNAVTVNNAGSFRPSEYVTTYANGGTDGTMTNAVLDLLAIEKFNLYGNPNSQVMDIAVNPETFFHDSGYSLNAKLAMANILAYRQDTIGVWTTFIADGPDLSNEDELAVGTAIYARLGMFPESSFFGTPTARAMIVGQSASLLGSNYIKRAPLAYDILVKVADYMGAANGKWKAKKDFDSGDAAVVTNCFNVSTPFKPYTVRNQEWKNGIVWAQPRDTRTMFFPALKTVYSDDTSVLNSFINVCAIPALVRAENAAWRQFSGNTRLDANQFTQAVEDFYTAQIVGIFDGRFKITPSCVITSQDAELGYVWHLDIRFEANNMRTVQVSSIQAYRMTATA